MDKCLTDEHELLCDRGPVGLAGRGVGQTEVHGVVVKPHFEVVLVEARGEGDGDALGRSESKAAIVAGGSRCGGGGSGGLGGDSGGFDDGSSGVDGASSGVCSGSRGAAGGWGGGAGAILGRHGPLMRVSEMLLGSGVCCVVS